MPTFEPVTRCPRCGTAARATSFCTGCGEDLQQTTPEAPPDGTPGVLPWNVATEVRLVACPRCGAPNAASRARCGRCGLDLDASPAGPGAGAATHNSLARRLSSRMLVAVTFLAALVIATLLLTFASGRGIGPFAGARSASDPVEAPVAAAVASSTGAGDLAPTNLIDGDRASAWAEATAGGGSGEWVQLRLAEPAAVTGLLVWNGHQRDAAFTEHGRVRALRVELGGRTFVVQLLDRRGPVAVDLPEPVRAERMRLVIDGVFAGSRYEDVALSEVEVLARPPAR